MPDPSPELEAEMQNLRAMAAQLETALAALKKQIDAADAAKAAREEGGKPEPPVEEQGS
jgi:hypothetical protein